MNDAGRGNFLYDNRIVDVHIQNLAAGFDVFLDFRRSVNVKRLSSIYLTGKHKNARESRYVVCMSMRNKNCIDFFPFEIQSFQANLCTLAAIKKKKVTLAAQQNRCQMSIW